MIWDLKYRVEDAFSAYLKTKLPGEISIYAAWEVDAPRFPCVVVHAGEMSPVSEEAEWHNPRKVAVQCVAMVEPAPEKQGGTVVRTVRERDIYVTSSLLSALATGELRQLLIATLTPRVAFSMAILGTVVPTVEDDPRVLVTTCNVEVIAEPTEEE